MSWLVTGGAGYIGSHVVRALQGAGIEPVVLDTLSSGVRSFVRDDVPFVHGSILDAELLDSTLRSYDVEGVVHLAGFKYAGVSVQKPLLTYDQNVTGTATLLAAMQQARCRPGDRGDRDPARIALRRVEADR
jgi:UDP-glucose 4-epimerase